MNRPINKISSEIFDKEHELIRCEESVVDMKKALRKSVKYAPLYKEAMRMRDENQVFGAEECLFMLA